MYRDLIQLWISATILVSLIAQSTTNKDKGCDSIYLLLKGDDPRLNLFQGEVIHSFSCGIREVGQMCAEICEQLSRDDETDIFIDHCQRNIEILSHICLDPNLQNRDADQDEARHTCFNKGLQGFQLICICKLNSFVQNLSIPTKDDTNYKPQLYLIETLIKSETDIQKAHYFKR